MKQLLLTLLSIGIIFLSAHVTLGQSIRLGSENEMYTGRYDAEFVAHLEDSTINSKPIDPKQARALSIYSTVIPSTIGATMVLFLDKENHPPLAPDDRFAGLKLIGASFLIGPSAGHIYSEQWKQSAVGIGLRSLGIVLSVGGGSELPVV